MPDLVEREPGLHAPILFKAFDFDFIIVTSERRDPWGSLFDAFGNCADGGVQAAADDVRKTAVAGSSPAPVPPHGVVQRIPPWTVRPAFGGKPFELVHELPPSEVGVGSRPPLPKEILRRD